MNFDEDKIRQIKLIHSHEEILEALQVIKDTCIRQKDCRTCPFYSNDKNECEINNVIPSEWEVRENEEIWHAFE